MRELIAFDCTGEALLGTLDRAAGTTGLLIVSGGNEIRTGAHRGMALLAARLAEHGVPVFRFDRRGIGDSSGENGGYVSSGPDIAAATVTFRGAQPQLTQMIGFGNCDAATALVLFGRDGAIDRLILANPWVVETIDDLPPAAAIRARYAEQLRDPKQWRRLLTGGVDISKLARGLQRIFSNSPQQDATFADRFFASLPGSARVILAERDATAQAFADEARRRGWSGPIDRIATASHSFAREGDAEALFRAIFAAIG